MPPTVPGVFLIRWRQPFYMKQKKHETHIESDEPVGIVISSGWEVESVPRFSAYMWAPAPEDDAEEDVQPALS